MTGGEDVDAVPPLAVPIPALRIACTAVGVGVNAVERDAEDTAREESPANAEAHSRRACSVHVAEHGSRLVEQPDPTTKVRSSAYPLPLLQHTSYLSFPGPTLFIYPSPPSLLFRDRIEDQY